MAQKLTDWFPDSIEPRREGVYEIRFENGNTLYALYSRWHKGFWRKNGEDRLQASKQTKHSFFAKAKRGEMQWRGLASDPSKGNV